MMLKYHIINILLSIILALIMYFIVCMVNHRNMKDLEDKEK